MDAQPDRLSVIITRNSLFSPVVTGIFVCSLVVITPCSLFTLAMWPVSIIAVAA